jgi:anti-sigma regulatory factor (Ser/Thr protein kinase)
MPAELSISLPCHRSAAGRARDAVRHRLGPELGERRTGDLALVVSELVANAAIHGRGEITLRVRLDDGRVHGEVIDEGGGFEREVRERGGDEGGGRGLLIVDALTSRWGIHEGTTHVWFELRSPDEPAKLTEPQLGEQARPAALDVPPRAT